MFIKLEEDNNIYCSGGSDYFFLGYSENLYKCLAQSWARKYKPLCNLDNYDIYFKQNNSIICEEFCCNESCDGMCVDAWKGSNKIYNSCWHAPASNIKNINNNNFRLYLEPVFGCLNDCKYCNSLYRNINYNDIKHINSKKLIKFLDFISKTKSGKKILFMAAAIGEPLLHPDFNNIIIKSIEKNFLVEIITSGLLETNKLFNIPISLRNSVGISISLHPTSKNWNKENMIRLMDKLILKSNWNYIIYKFVIKTKNNINDQYINLAKEFSLKYNVKLDFIEYQDVQ